MTDIAETAFTVIEIAMALGDEPRTIAERAGDFSDLPGRIRALRKYADECEALFKPGAHFEIRVSEQGDVEVAHYD